MACSKWWRTDWQKFDDEDDENKDRDITNLIFKNVPLSPDSEDEEQSKKEVKKKQELIEEELQLREREEQKKNEEFQKVLELEIAKEKFRLDGPLLPSFFTNASSTQNVSETITTSKIFFMLSSRYNT